VVNAGDALTVTDQTDDPASPARAMPNTMTKLAVGDGEVAVAIVNASLELGHASRVWMLRGRLAKRTALTPRTKLATARSRRCSRSP
jgi:hypothetical protein